MTGKQTNKNNNHIHSQNGYHPKRHPKHECSYLCEEYLKDLNARIQMSIFTPNHSLIGKRIAMIKVFEFLNTNGLRIFGFSGSEGNFIKTLMEKTDGWLVELNEEIAQGEESKRVLKLDKKAVSVIEACKQMVTDHKTGVLMALYSHFPQDIVREIAENYV
jgi:hypothetical protein